MPMVEHWPLLIAAAFAASTVAAIAGTGVGFNWRLFDFRVFGWFVAGAIPLAALGPVIVLGAYAGKRILDRIPARVFLLIIEAVIAGFGLWFLLRPGPG